jgi:pyridinium-3,5-biscarboxylic acid mononucleotide sulfurtransferase
MEEPEKTQSCQRLLKDLGFNSCRVIHRGDMVRLQVPPEIIGRFAEPGVRERMVRGLKTLGFKYIGLDLVGALTLPAPAATARSSDEPQR